MGDKWGRADMAACVELGKKLGTFVKHLGAVNWVGVDPYEIQLFTSVCSTWLHWLLRGGERTLTSCDVPSPSSPQSCIEAFEEVLGTLGVGFEADPKLFSMGGVYYSAVTTFCRQKTPRPQASPEYSLDYATVVGLHEFSRLAKEIRHMNFFTQSKMAHDILYSLFYTTIPSVVFPEKHNSRSASFDRPMTNEKQAVVAVFHHGFLVGSGMDVRYIHDGGSTTVTPADEEATTTYMASFHKSK